MSVSTVRIVIEGVTVRLFEKRFDANVDANRRTEFSKTSPMNWEQYGVKKIDNGYLVENKVSKALFDADGELPKTVQDVLRSRA